MIPHVHRFHFCLLACLVAIGLLVVVVDLTAATTITEEVDKLYASDFLSKAEQVFQSVKQLGGGGDQHLPPSKAQLAELESEVDNLIERLDPVEERMRAEIHTLYDTSNQILGTTKREVDTAHKEGTLLAGKLVELNRPVYTARALLRGWELHGWDENAYTKVTPENAVHQARAFIEAAAGSADGMSPETRKQHARMFLELFDAKVRMITANNLRRMFTAKSRISEWRRNEAKGDMNVAATELDEITVLVEKLGEIIAA